jgi:hypothetical protein
MPNIEPAIPCKLISIEPVVEALDLAVMEQ